MKKYKKFEKILFLFFILTNILIISLVYKKEEKNYNKYLISQIEEKKRIFQLKTDLLYSSILDLKNEKIFNILFSYTLVFNCFRLYKKNFIFNSGSNWLSL